jgi:hypothetical protein
MAEPKGTYYSPQESGFATVLRPGPNFLGMAQQQQALAARKDQLAMQQKQKLDNEREKQVGKIAADMGKPVPTAFPWQEETNKRLTEGLNKIQKMYLDDKPVSDIRFEAERTVADVISYGAAAKQFFAEANGNVKKLGKEYKQDEVLKLVAGKFVGEDGTPIDARKADWEDINPEKAIFESPEPWKFLDENLVVKGFLNNPTFQENAMSIQKKVDTGELGRFYKVGTTTTSTKAAGKIYSIDPMTGTSQISDADTLIENGVFDMMLGDRKMLAVVDKYVNELTSDRLVPIDEDQKDIMRAGVLADLLEKRTPGPSTVQRINEKYMPKYVSSGGPTKSQEEYMGGEKFIKSFKSGDYGLLKDAIAFAMSGDSAIEILPPGAVGGDEKLEALSPSKDGESFVASIVKLNSDGSIKMSKGIPELRLKTFNVSEIDENILRTAHARGAAKNKRAYGTDELGKEFQPSVSNQTQQSAPQFSIFKNKK